MAPQVGLEPTTLRLTARRLHQNGGAYPVANNPQILRYLANGSQFSPRPPNAVAPAFPISVALRYANDYKEFELASPQKSPQCYVLRNQSRKEDWWTWKRFSLSTMRIFGRRKPRRWPS